MKKIKFQRPTGMHDILSFDQRYFKKISNLVDEISDFYGFNKIDTPILEQEDLFHKGIGDQTDITQKEIDWGEYLRAANDALLESRVVKEEDLDKVLSKQLLIG